MAAEELQELACEMNISNSCERDAEMSGSSVKAGGWITFPFITGTLVGMVLGGMGWLSNLIVYLVREFNVKSINAAQISNVVNGCTSLFPVIGAIIADSWLGCFSVISISSFISLLGLTLLALTAILNALRPSPCENGSSLCEAPSRIQFVVLYASIAMASIGLGGARFTISTMGANQFGNQRRDQDVYFNWYFFAMYVSSFIGATVIVYIEDNVGWGLGFGLCVLVNLLAFVIFLLGKRFYVHDKPGKGSPFVGLAHVVVASIRKRNMPHSSRNEDYFYGDLDGKPGKMVAATPTQSFRFLNRAALKTDGDLKVDGSIANPWMLCTVQQVEDLKALIRIVPLWSSSIFLSVPIAIQNSLTVLQALAMDRHIIGPNFKIPAGSFIVIVLISTSISLPIIDRFLCPTWRRSPTPLQRIGLGHVLTIFSMATSAVMESNRLKTMPRAKSALLLFPQLVLVGIGEAFHFPGQVSLYYQEFPDSLRSTATAMVAMVIGISFYLSTAVIDLVRRVTGWLPDDINDGRLDDVYWTVTVIGVINFGYYVLCAKFYKYQNVDN